MTLSSLQAKIYQPQQTEQKSEWTESTLKMGHFIQKRYWMGRKSQVDWSFLTLNVWGFLSLHNCYEFNYLKANPLRVDNCLEDNQIMAWTLPFSSGKCASFPTVLSIIYQDKSNLFWDCIHKYSLSPRQQRKSSSSSLEQMEEEARL